MYQNLRQSSHKFFTQNGKILPNLVIPSRASIRLVFKNQVKLFSVKVKKAQFFG
jgi:hypothetical protein